MARWQPGITRAPRGEGEHHGDTVGTWEHTAGAALQAVALLTLRLPLQLKSLDKAGVLNRTKTMDRGKRIR